MLPLNVTVQWQYNNLHENNFNKNYHFAIAPIRLGASGLNSLFYYYTNIEVMKNIMDDRTHINLFISLYGPLGSL